MRYLILTAMIFIMSCSQEVEKPPEASQEQVVMDGEYEMKQYYFVMLTKGEKRDSITDTAVINDLQQKHLANIDRLAEKGKILVAGPFGDDGIWRGIFIFDCPTQAEVEELLNTDPAISTGVLSYEVHPWWTAKNEVFK